MKIGEVIERHNGEWRRLLKKKDNVYSNHMTQEDVYQDVMVTALKKYGDKDINEDDGVKYILKTLNMELFFFPKKMAMGARKEVLIEDMECPPPEPLYII